MDRARLVTVGFLLVGALSICLGHRPQKVQSEGCHFPAIYNFGDANSDTGASSALFSRFGSPLGKTFFGKPSGRTCDGRLIIDFIAQKLGLPLLNAYLDSLGANFRHGANFATSASTILPIDGRMFKNGYSPISLNIQLSQFVQLKERVNEVYSEGKSLNVSTTLPRLEDFSKALYTFDIGQNDLHAGLRWKTVDQVRDSISDMTSHLALAIKQVYQQGGRVFWIHNTGPIGCLPSSSPTYKLPIRGELDRNGCLKLSNEVSREFNKQLKETVIKLRNHLPVALLTYVDIYAAKHKLISEADKYGFSDPLAQCCGRSYGDHPLKCTVNSSCSDPSQYISWDGVHYSDAANKWVAQRIMKGSFSDPPVSITEACHKHPIL